MGRPTILHLGLGSFHRAHLAYYIHRLASLTVSRDSAWQIAAGNIRNDNPDLIRSLHAQNGAYTLEMVDEKGQREYERVESITRIVEWDASLDGFKKVACEADTHLISFTVTEAGYYLGKGPSGRESLFVDHPDVAHDLKGAGEPHTLYKALTMILKARIGAFGGPKTCPPTTLMSCDNLRSNGSRFSAGFAEFLVLLGDPELLEYVRTKTIAPNTMVDRITPRPDVAAIQSRIAQLGPSSAGSWVPNDACPVMAESYHEFVVEMAEPWPTPRPPFEELERVTLTASVLPYEDVKIRTLNATHTLIAWAGGLIDCHYIHDTLTVEQIRDWCLDYITNEVIPVLTPTCPPGLSLETYRDTVLARFTNAHLADTCARVAMDGYSKVPGQIAVTIRDRLAGRGSMESAEASKLIIGTARITALFLAFLKRLVQGTLPFPYADQACDLDVVRSYFLPGADEVEAFASDPVLWTIAGEHGESISLAGDPALMAALQKAHQEVNEWAASFKK